MTTVTYTEAVLQGLAEEMRRDPRVWALGEDMSTAPTSAHYAGLIDEFGPQRIVNTPISESTIMGAAVGAAVVGTRPVAEFRNIDFGICAMDELVNQAAKIRYMFGGQARVPLVVRQGIGARAGAAAQHSGSYEAWFVHVAGLVVVTPATPADGKGLLKSAIRCDDPVVFMEHKELFGSKGEIPDDPDYTIPIGKARLAREGKHLTIVAWSKMALLAEDAARQLSNEGIEAEVIDLRSLWPWDRDAVLESVSKTKHLLIPQEAVEIGGFAAEVAYEVTSALSKTLKAPVKRIGAPRTPFPYAQNLEDEVRVKASDIVREAKKLLA